MDLGYFRWDYMSLWFECEPDEFHRHLQRLDTIALSHPTCCDWKKLSKVKALGSTTGGKRRYAVTAWGRGCNIVNYLPVSYHQNLHRLDIKAWPEGYTMADLEQLRAEMVNSKCAYNVTMHDGKLRQKNEKRDAGGKSLAIGSHKSDLRVSIYGRGNEAVCMEFQCSGDMLRRILDDQASKPEGRRDSFSFWVMVKDQIQQVGVARYNRALDTAGISQWRPTTPEEREAFALDEADRVASAEAQQAQLDLDTAGHTWEADEPPPHT